MSTTVGMGSKKKEDAKAAEAKLKKELKKVTAENDELKKENAVLKERISALESNQAE